jgi:predicted transcriptional regulator
MHIIRQIWHLVSENPRINIRDLSKHTRRHHTVVLKALAYLEHCGYISHARGASGRRARGTRRVLVPLV